MDEMREAKRFYVVKTIILGLISLCAGVIFLGVLGHAWWLDRQSQTWPAVRGTVLSAEVTSRPTGYGGTATSARLRYQYEIDGKAYEHNCVRFGDCSWGGERTTARYPTGTSVMVYSNPENPQQAVLEHSNWYFFALLIGILAILPIAFGVYLLGWTKKVAGELEQMKDEFM